jgi:hypothetical protein
MDKPALVDPPCLEPENKAPNVDISSTHGLEKKPRMRGVLHSYAAAGGSPIRAGAMRSMWSC